MATTRREVRRFTDGSGRTLFFAVHLGSRRAGWRFFQPGEVPEFEGETARFEVEVVKGRWVFGRRIEAIDQGHPD
jgi:hypothetical protein